MKKTEYNTEVLERAYSDKGTIKERMDNYPKLVELFRKHKRNEAAFRISLDKELHLSESCQRYIWNYFDSEEYSVRIGLARSIDREVKDFTIACEKFWTLSLISVRRLDRTLEALNMYHLLSILKEKVSLEEYTTLLMALSTPIDRRGGECLSIEGKGKDIHPSLNLRLIEIGIGNSLHSSEVAKRGLLRRIEPPKRLINEYEIGGVVSKEVLEEIERGEGYIATLERYLSEYLKNLRVHFEELEHILPEESRSVFMEILDGDKVTKGLEDDIKKILNIKLSEEDYGKRKEELLPKLSRDR